MCDFKLNIQKHFLIVEKYCGIMIAMGTFERIIRVAFYAIVIGFTKSNS